MPSVQKGSARHLGPATPLSLHWHSLYNPIPVREVRGQQRSNTAAEAAPWIDSGTPGLPFDFSLYLRNLCDDIAARCELLRHLDIPKILFAFTQSRNQHSHGLQARVTPLRFHDGELTRMHRGVPYRVQQFFHDDQELLYVLTCCLPRFLNRSFEDKFVTIFHELFHISPAFDGDLRRHHGRYSLHTASQKRYDQEMAAIAREYLSSGVDPGKYAFLRLNYAQIRHRHGKILGHVVPRPKLIPVRSLKG